MRTVFVRRPTAARRSVGDDAAGWLHLVARRDVTDRRTRLHDAGKAQRQTREGEGNGDSSSPTPCYERSSAKPTKSSRISQSGRWKTQAKTTTTCRPANDPNPAEPSAMVLELQRLVEEHCLAVLVAVADG